MTFKIIIKYYVINFIFPKNHEILLYRSFKVMIPKIICNTVVLEHS